MIISPIQNNAIFNLNWIQTRPTVTQKFGNVLPIYTNSGLRGHPGYDFRAAVGTPLFAPIEGQMTVHENNSLGLHVKINNGRLMALLAHLSDVYVNVGTFIRLGEPLGLSGNTGISTAPHLHIALYKVNGNGKILDLNNGYGGSFDFLKYMITWRGTCLTNILSSS